MKHTNISYKGHRGRSKGWKPAPKPETKSEARRKIIQTASPSFGTPVERKIVMAINSLRKNDSSTALSLLETIKLGDFLD